MKRLLGTVALAGMLMVPSTAQAQLTAGPLAAFHDDFDFGIGGYLSIPVPSLDENLSIDPSFVFYFPDGPVDYWEINGDVVYHFEVAPDTPVLPYAMAGLSLERFSPDVGNSNTEMELNLGGGIGFRAQSLRPFVGAKFEIGDNDGFVVYGGLGFAVGG